jgi:hypothetical protein
MARKISVVFAPVLIAWALSDSVARADVVHLGNAGHIDNGTMIADIAEWNAKYVHAFSYARDYLDFKLTLNASEAEVDINIAPNLLGGPPGLKWELGTAKGTGNIIGPTSNFNIVSLSSMLLKDTEYYISFYSTGGGNFTADVRQDTPATPLPGALILFGTVLGGSSILFRRKSLSGATQS